MFGKQFREKCGHYTVLKCPDCGIQYQVSWATFVNMLHVKPYVEIVCVGCGSVVKKAGSKRGG